MAVSLKALLSSVDRLAWRKTILGFAQLSGFSVTSWASGRPVRTIFEILSFLAEDLVGARLYNFASSGFLDYATGDWLSLYASSQFDLTRKPELTTRGTIRLVDGGGGPYTIQPGQLRAETPDHLVYSNVTGGTLALDGTLDLEWQAEKPGVKYNVPILGITTLLTDLPGVTVTNPEVGVTGTWITRAGADVESDADLRIRCRSRWGTLGTGANAAAWRFWALTASEEVTKVNVYDAAGDGSITIAIGGNAGPVTTDALDAVTDYLTDESRRPLCSTVNVWNVMLVPRYINTTVYAKASQRAEVAAGIAAALTNLQNSYSIGASVYGSEVAEAILSVPGVRNLDVSTLPADVTLGISSLPSFVNNVQLVSV